MSYLHFLPPHDPYTTHREFYKRFKDDGLAPQSKPVDSLQYFEDVRFPNALSLRMHYDEYILYLDREFARLFSYLENTGVLENSWIILTSDHGELFERDVVGHTTPLLYEPIIRVPLMIFEPGRKKRLDVRTPTSSIDLLPTLLHVTDQPAVDWAEGSIFPSFSSTHPAGKGSVYAVEATNSGLNSPLIPATFALIREQYKLIYYTGYDELDGQERAELFDLEADPEELNDIYSSRRDTADELLSELKEKLIQVNKPYTRL